MVHLWHNISPGKGVPRLVEAVIEIPKAGKVKYELDKDLGVLRATRVLHGAVQYPANYGFIPRSLGEDGDALDILVLGQEDLVPGTIVTGRVIGVMPLLNREQRDDKIIAVQIGDPEYENIRSLGDLPPHRMNELMRFFGDYKVVEGREVRAAAPLDQAEAVLIVEKALSQYESEVAVQ
jgi:inorganic pyrophosphatase